MNALKLLFVIPWGMFLFGLWDIVTAPFKFGGSILFGSHGGHTAGLCQGFMFIGFLFSALICAVEVIAVMITIWVFCK